MSQRIIIEPYIDGTTLTGDGGVSNPVRVNEAAAVALSSTAPQAIFRPLDPSGDHANVRTTWEAAYALIQPAIGLGAVIQLDNSLVPPDISDPFSPGPIHIPVNPNSVTGRWLMDHVTVTNVPQQGHTTVIFDEDTLAGKGAGWETSDPNLAIRLDGWGLYLVSDRIGAIAPFEAVHFQVTGYNVRFFNTNPLALPMVVLPPGGFMLWFWDGSHQFGGLGPAPQPSPNPHDQLPDAVAPIVDLNGGFCLFAIGGGYIANNGFTDLSLGGGGVVGISPAPDAWGNQFSLYNFPALVANGGFPLLFPEDQVYPDRTAHVFGVVTAAMSPYPLQLCELAPTDSAAGLINLVAPSAAMAPGQFIMAKDFTGSAAAFNVTVTPTGGDTVESPALTVNGQVKTWRSDGVSTWMLVGNSIP